MNGLVSLFSRFKMALSNKIKIDVDGNEQKVIDGFGEILHDKRLKSIMVEINLTQENNFIDRIQSNGFKKIENKEYVNQDY